MAGANGTTEPPAIDLTAFIAGTASAPGSTSVPLSIPRSSFLLGAEAHVVAQLGYGLDPRRVPVAALQLMSTNPAVYLAERILTGVVRRPDLFTVKHPDARMRAEVTAWLWPLLPRLTSAAARAFAYGAAAVALDWGRRPLLVPAPAAQEGSDANDPNRLARDGTLVATAPRTVYIRAVEVHPDLTSVVLDQGGEILALTANGQMVDASRAQVWSWDPEFGEVVGQGARRRAWRDYCGHLIISLLRDKYLERSVDPLRVGKAPQGKATVGGVDYEIPALVAKMIDDARGSGVLVFPSVFYESSTNPKYGVEMLETSADRGEVFADALNRAEERILLAYLVAPGLAGGSAEAGANQVLDGQLRDHVEAFADTVAQGLTRLVGIVHRLNYPVTVAEPEIVATDVGKATARKVFLDVLRMVTQTPQGEVAVRTDVPALLDKVGIGVREEDEAPESARIVPPPAGPDGRKVEPFGDRQTRREDAGDGTPGGQATGAPAGDDGAPETQGGGTAGALSAAPVGAAADALALRLARDRDALERAALERLERSHEEADERMARAVERLTAEQVAAKVAEAEVRGRAQGEELGATRARLEAAGLSVEIVAAAEARGAERGAVLGEARGRAAALAEAPAPIVNVTTPAPIVNVTAAAAAPDVHVHVPPPAERRVTVKRDVDGRMTGAEIKGA